MIWHDPFGLNHPVEGFKTMLTLSLPDELGGSSAQVLPGLSEKPSTSV